MYKISYPWCILSTDILAIQQETFFNLKASKSTSSSLRFYLVSSTISDVVYFIFKDFGLGAGATNSKRDITYANSSSR